MKNKFKPGDELKVVNYGHLIWEVKTSDIQNASLPVYREEDNIVIYDLYADAVGQTGVVVEVINTQGIPQYALDGISGKSAWFNEDQLEKI